MSGNQVARGVGPVRIGECCVNRFGPHAPIGTWFNEAIKVLASSTIRHGAERWQGRALVMTVSIYDASSTFVATPSCVPHGVLKILWSPEDRRPNEKERREIK